MSFIKIYFLSSTVQGQAMQMVRVWPAVQLLCLCIFWSLVWDGNLNKEITSTDSEKQPLYNLVLSSCDVYFLPFSAVILEVFFFFFQLEP